MATPSFVTKQGVDARHKPGMTVESHRQELRHRYSFLHPLLRHAGALPRGTSRRVSVQIVGFEPFPPPTEGSRAPKFPGPETHPLRCLTGCPLPSGETGCRPLTRTGGPSRPPLGVSFNLRAPLWETARG